MGDKEGMDGLRTEDIIESWESGNLRFHIILHPRLGHYCGYCVFPQKCVRETGYSGLLTYVPVHGGITWARENENGAMTYGFDCAHAGDEDDPRCRDLLWLKIEAERMARAVITAAKYEADYLLAADNEKKAEVIDAYHAEIAQELEIEFAVQDNFGAMINVLCGRL